MSYKRYRLDFDNIEFWKNKYDKETSELFYERVKESGSLYFKKADYDYFFDEMICNCFNDESDKPENMRLREYENCNYYYIEPSGIKIPKSNLIPILDKSKIIKDESLSLQDISTNTFLCNCISNRTRGGRNRISATEIEDYKKEIIDAINDTFSNKSFASSYALVSIFSIINYEYIIPSFNRDKLLQFIIDNKEESKYSKLLSNIKIEYYEHYDWCEGLEKAIEVLKYLGILHPNYSQEDTYDYNPYINLAIDTNIKYWMENGTDKRLKAQYPEMIEFVDDYNSVMKYITAGVKNTARIRKK